MTLPRYLACGLVWGLIVFTPGLASADDLVETGWLVHAAAGENGIGFGAVNGLYRPFGDSPWLLTLEFGDFGLTFDDGLSLFQLSGALTTLGVIFGVLDDEGTGRNIAYALMAPEVLSNLGLAIQDEKRRRVFLGMDSDLYTWANEEARLAHQDRFFLGMHFRPHLGVMLPAGDRHATFVSVGPTYNWDWHGDSGGLGWDVQLGVALNTGADQR